MKKDRLYTMRKGMPALFVDRKNNNVFDGFEASNLTLPTGWSEDTYRRLAFSSLDPMQNAFHNYAQSISDNFGKGPLVPNNSPFKTTTGPSLANQNASTFFRSGSSSKSDSTSKPSVSIKPSKMQAIGMAASAIGSIPTGDKRGMWDTLDPIYHIAGGRESTAGNAMSDAGVGLTQAGLQSGNGWLALAGAGLKIVGGLTNAAFGVKEHTGNINFVKNNTARAKNAGNLMSGATTTDDLIDASGSMVTGSGLNWNDLYDNGWFTSKGTRKGKALLTDENKALAFQGHALGSSADAVDTLADNDVMAHFGALGGDFGNYNDNNMGAIEYDFMRDYLTEKKRQNDIKNKLSGVSSMPAFMNNGYALGGDTQSHGADWTSGLVYIDAGKSHEENAYGGVPFGHDNEGVPNLVEEGETVYNDYVFSNRIYADGGTLQKFHLPKKSKITFADLSKRLGKEIKERENDPISRAGFKADMAVLREEQERQKQEMEAEKAKAAFEALSPEEQVAVMDNVAQQEQVAQQQAIQEEAMAQQQVAPEEMAMMEGQVMPEEQIPVENMSAYGGNVFGNGGEVALKWLRKNNDIGLTNRELKEVADAMGKYIDTKHPNINAETLNMPAVYGKFFKGWKASQDGYGQNYQDMRKAGISKTAALKILKNRKKWSNDSAENDRQWETIASKWEIKPSNTTKAVKGKKEVANTASTEGKPPVDWNTLDIPTFQSTTPATSNNNTVQAMQEAANENAVPAPQRQATQRQATVNTAAPVSDVGATGLRKYDWYRNGSDGYSQPWGFTVGENGLIDTETGYTDDYRNLVNTLGAKDIKDWAVAHPEDPSLQSFLSRNYNGNLDAFIADDSFKDETWRTGATDGKYGFMHHVASEFGKNTPLAVSPEDAAAIMESEQSGNFDATAPVETSQQSVAGQYGAPWAENNTDAASTGSEGVTVATDPSTGEKKIVPVLRKEWPRYLGLLGPAVGLGMMAAGVGRPSTKDLDAALDSYDNAGTALADVRYIGDYMPYRPFDVWSQHNRNAANLNSAIRSIQDNAAPVGTQMVGTLAALYNGINADGELGIKADQYNYNNLLQSKTFNRGTNQFNAEAYNRAALANAQSRNASRGARANLAAQIASQKMHADSDWYGSLYGNVAGLFKGISDLGRENADRNWVARLAASGALPGITPDNAINAGLVKYAAMGGKIKRKKNKKGLTF